MYIIFYRIWWFRRFVDKTRMVSSRFRRGFVVRTLRASHMRVEINPFLAVKNKWERLQMVSLAVRQRGQRRAHTKFSFDTSGSWILYWCEEDSKLDCCVLLLIAGFPRRGRGSNCFPFRRKARTRRPSLQNDCPRLFMEYTTELATTRC